MNNLNINAVIAVLLCFAFLRGTAQQQEATPIKMKPYVKVNFKQLAASEKLHPVFAETELGGEPDEETKIFQPVITSDTVSATVKESNLSVPGQADNLSEANSPSPTLTFNGDFQSSNNNTNSIPPDPDGAVGSKYIVEVVNQDVTIFNKSGTQVSQFGQNTLANAIGCASNGDMHVLYDAINERYLICFLIHSSPENNGTGYTTVGIAYGVSETNDPTGNWEMNYFDANTTFIDFPGMGYNQTWFVITGNDITNGGAKIWVFDYASVLSASNAQGSTGFLFTGSYNTLGPAQTYDANITTEYLVADAGDGTHMQIYTITGAAGSTPVFTTSTQLTSGSPWSETRVGVLALGSTTPIETGVDLRVYSAIYANGQLWFTHDVFLPATTPTYTGIDWWEFNPSAKTVTQYGRLSNSTLSAFYPSINVNANGDAMLTFCEASTSEYVGAYYAFHATTDAASTTEGVGTLANGQGPYTQLVSGRNRWGDYTGTGVDPTDGSFWGISEWAANNGTSGQWETVIGHLPPSAGVCNGNIDLGSGVYTDFSTESSGTITSENTIPNYAYVNLSAESAVILKVGFLAVTGSSFDAINADCGVILTPELRSESDVLTGVLPSANDEQLKIFPNPFNSSFDLLLTVEQNSGATINVYDLLGGLVKQIPQWQLAAGDNMMSIDMGTFASGLYLVEVNFGDIKVMKKIIKS